MGKRLRVVGLLTFGVLAMDQLRKLYWAAYGLLLTGPIQVAVVVLLAVVVAAGKF